MMKFCFLFIWGGGMVKEAVTWRSTQHATVLLPPLFSYSHSPSPLKTATHPLVGIPFPLKQQQPTPRPCESWIDLEWAIEVFSYENVLVSADERRQISAFGGINTSTGLTWNRLSLEIGRLISSGQTHKEPFRGALEKDLDGWLCQAFFKTLLTHRSFSTRALSTSRLCQQADLDLSPCPIPHELQECGPLFIPSMTLFPNP